MFAIIRSYSATVSAVVLSIVLLVSIIQISGSQPALLQPALASPQQLLSTTTDEPAQTSGRIDTELLAERMNLSFTPGGADTPLSNTLSQKHLNRLGYDADDVWKAGIILIPYDGTVEKACGGLSGNVTVSGLAVKPDAVYPTCSDGSRIIPADYQVATKCSVHFNASTAAQTAQRGSTSAILAHEIGHCLQFIYGEGKGINSAFRTIRPEVALLSEHALNEVFADDFMLCRHEINTNWGVDSYYSKYSVSEPTNDQCGRLNALFDVYFPL